MGFKMQWDQTGEHLYRTGIDRGVIYDVNNSGAYVDGEVWNGLTGFTKSPSGAEETKLYADNIKYLSLRSAEDFGATITCYTFPKLFEIKNGSVEVADGVKIYQQARKSFGLCVRTLIGNDVDGNDKGYELHLCYGLTASPSEEAYNTVNDSPEAIEFSYELASVPVEVGGNYKPTAVITISSLTADPEKLVDLEAALYGADTDTYVPVTWGKATDNPSTKGWYELSGTSYTASADTEYSSSKTYYKKLTSGDAHMPLPAEVIQMMTVTTGG